MNKNYTTEIIIAGGIALLLILLSDPFMIWMPSMMQMLIITGLIVIVGVFATLMWREQAHDERENIHRNSAGRAGFLAGAVVLTVGIVLQSVNHVLDPWLTYALGAMVIAKTVSLIYSSRKG